MAIKDQKNILKVLGTIAPVAAGDDVTGTVVAVDGFEAVTLYGHGDGTAIGTIKIQESATSGGTYTDVAAADIIGTQDIAINATYTDVTIGYIGSLGFLKAFYTEGTPGDISASFILGHADVSPVSGNDN